MRIGLMFLQVTVESFHYIDNERDMKRYVRTTGPLSVCVSAEVKNAHYTLLPDVSVCGNGRIIFFMCCVQFQ